MKKVNVKLCLEKFFVRCSKTWFINIEIFGRIFGRMLRFFAECFGFGRMSKFHIRSSTKSWRDYYDCLHFSVEDPNTWFNPLNGPTEDSWIQNTDADRSAVRRWPISLLCTNRVSQQVWICLAVTLFVWSIKIPQEILYTSFR